ncbi:MAG: type VI secretion system membrane subunit TssM, partial [Reinekea sp.]
MRVLVMKLLPFLARFFTGIFAGFVGLAVIIWFAGRYVGLTSVQYRIIAILALFGIYLLWIVSHFLYTRLRGQKLAEDLAEDLGDDELKKKLQDVLSALKSTNLGRKFRGRGALYALPWYMIIGPSAAGKSTFYARSGLNFPFKDDERYHFSGIGGTKNCDWWFSDQAVLIDTAGRYSAEEDGPEWLHFLRLLKRNRPRVPVNGVILALPMDELLMSDKDSLQSHANNTRNRLQEIMSELGLMVPVYIVLTKCDMVRGFDAFFEDLSESESTQPWGVYVLDQTEDRKADVVGIFRERINTLTDRLLEQRTQKMLLTKSVLKRADIYQYPTQFTASADRLLEFIELLFKDSPYHEKPWLAGVYFTSSVPEGKVIENRGGLVKTMFSKVISNTHRANTNGRSYFVSELFTQVVFPLKEAVRGSRSRQRFNLAAKSFAFTIMVGVIVGSGLTLTGTYTANLKLLSNYETKAETLVERLESPEISEVERLNALAALHRHFQDLEEISTYSPLRLFTRYDLIGTHGEPMRNLLVRTLERAMTMQIRPYFMEEFSDLQVRWESMSDQDQNEMRLAYYDNLKVYQMLTSRPDQYDRDYVSRLLADIWFQSFGEDNVALSYDQDIGELKGLVALYLQYSFETLDMNMPNIWDQGSDIVTMAQKDLMTPPDADLLYQQIISKGNSLFEDVSLRDLLGPTVDGVLRNKLVFSGIYTEQAWHQFVKKEIKQSSYSASKGDWVLGLESVGSDDDKVEASADKLEQSIRRKYFSDYVDNWTKLVKDTSSINNRDLAESIQIIKMLSEEEGLLHTLFGHIQKNAFLAEVEQIEVENPSDDGDDAISLPAPPVIPAFASLSKDLRVLLKDSDDSGVADVLENYLAEVAPLADELDSIRVASDVDMEARNYAAGVLSGDSGNKKLYSAWINVDNLLQRQEKLSRVMISNLFTSPLKTVWAGMIDASERSLQAMWQDTVYRSYGGSIKGRFPFNDKGADAAVRDVTQFFSPDVGLLWSFVDAELKPFVQIRSGNWKVRTWLGHGLAFNKDVFSGVNSANQIVTSLFDDQNVVSMRFWVSPVPTPGVSESIFEVDSNTYRYRNEPEEWREFNWSLESSQFAKVQIQLNSGSGYADLSYEGPWAFLKLLRSSEVTHTGGTQFNVLFPLQLSDGKRVAAQYKIRADRVGSVLNH